jgi:hypothetical protein
MNSRSDIDWQAIEPDYTPEYVAGLRRLTGVQKLAAAGAQFRMARKIKAAALRRRHPDWNEQQVQQEVSRLLLHSAST